MQIQTAIRRPILTQIASLATMPLKSPTPEQLTSPRRSIPKKGSFKRFPPSSTTEPVHPPRLTSSERGMILDIMKRLRSRSQETGVVKKNEFLHTCVTVSGRLKGKKIANRCIRQGFVLPYGDRVYLSFKSIEQELQNRLTPSKEAMQEFLKKKQEKLEQMEDTKQRMDALVEGKTKRFQLFGLVVMVAQWILYCHLTYFRLSWDVMEPVSYLTAYLVAIGLLIYTIQTRRLSFVENIVNSYREREQKRFYQLVSFDLKEYTKLKDEIDLYRRMHWMRLQ